MTVSNFSVSNCKEDLVKSELDASAPVGAARVPRRAAAVRAVAVAGVLLSAAGLVAACGGSSSNSSGQPAGMTGAPGQGGPGGEGNFGQEFTAIRQCLTAAGISVPTFSPRARGSFTGTPSWTPGERPTGSFTRSPGMGGPGGRGGGMMSILNDPKAQAALKACGLTMPTRGNFPRPTASS